MNKLNSGVPFEKDLHDKGSDSRSIKMITEHISNDVQNNGIHIKKSATGFNKKGNYLLSDFDHLRVTKEKDISQPVPTITIAGAAVASAANITGISAGAKAGKTALTGVIIAGAISKTGFIDGFDDLKVLPNQDGKAVIHFDTEQSAPDQQHFINSVLKRGELETTPDYFRSYNIRQLTLADYQETTEAICELCSNTFGGVHLIVIDGGADYLASVNDEAQATRIVHCFTLLSIKYNCPVLIIIHLNPGSDKERGHFGSEVQRKCYGLLTITKESDISTVQPKIMRKAGNGEIPLIHFTFSKEKGYHVQIDAPDKCAESAKRTREKIEAIGAKVFAPPSAYRTNDAIRKIAQSESVSESTAKRYLRQLDVWECITKHDDGFYRINTTGVNRGQPGLN